MLRILQIVSSLQKNGTETFIMNLFRSLDKNEVMFDFLIFDNRKTGFYDELISLGSKIYQLPPRKESFIGYHKALDSFFKEHATDYDAVHYHGMSFTSIAPVFYARKHGVKKRIFHVHGKNCRGLHNKVFHKINRRRLSSQGTHFLGCSQEALKWGYPSRILSDKTKVITNGIDLKKFRFNNEVRMSVRNELGLSMDDFVIGHVGNFNPIKNHRFLIDTFEKVFQSDPRSYLICVGQGELLEIMKKIAEEKGLKERIIFMGHRDNVNDIIQAMDIMVFPSLHEGLGFVLIEAQAAALPVVASTGVPQEVKASDYFSFLSLKDKAERWAEEINFYKNILRNQTISRNLNKFSIENTREEILKIYKS